MLLTQANIEALNKGFSKVYRTGYDSSPNWCDQITTTIPSTHGSEVHGWMARILKMRKWDGPRLIQNLNTHTYTLINQTYENTVGVSVNEIEDDSLGVYDPLFSELGRQSAKWKDQRMKEALQNGTTELCFDGLSFFNANHTIDPAGVQSNTFTSSALSAANFEIVRTAMRNYTGEDGEPLGVDPRLLVVSPANEKEALEIVSAERNSSGATNVLRGTAEVLVIPELANEPTVWYLMDVSKGIKPFVFQNRQNPVLTQKTSMTDDNVFKDDQFLWGVKARGVEGYASLVACGPLNRLMG